MIEDRHFTMGGHPLCGLPIREARNLTDFAGAVTCEGCRIVLKAEPSIPYAVAQIDAADGRVISVAWHKRPKWAVRAAEVRAALDREAGKVRRHTIYDHTNPAVKPPVLLSVDENGRKRGPWANLEGGTTP